MARLLKALVAAATFAVSSASTAAPCAAGSLADYLVLGSCEIGATGFTGFGLLGLSGGVVPIDPAAIAVTPIALPTQVGFAFAITASAGPGDVLEAFFRFQVVAALGASLTRADQSLAGASAQGDGVSLLLTDLCFDGVFASPPVNCGGSGADTMISFAIAGDGEADAFTLLAVTALDVVVDFIVDGGVAGGATISGGSLAFTTDATPPPGVPEPAPLALLALLPLAWTFARRAVRARA